jgi:hypothetical protein
MSYDKTVSIIVLILEFCNFRSIIQGNLPIMVSMLRKQLCMLVHLPTDVDVVSNSELSRMRGKYFYIPLTSTRQKVTRPITPLAA